MNDLVRLAWRDFPSVIMVSVMTAVLTLAMIVGFATVFGGEAVSQRSLIICLNQEIYRALKNHDPDIKNPRLVDVSGVDCDAVFNGVKH